MITTCLLFVPGGGSICPKGWDDVSQVVGQSVTNLNIVVIHPCGSLNYAKLGEKTAMM